jgi:hypothetical protein
MRFPALFADEHGFVDDSMAPPKRVVARAFSEAPAKEKTP